MMMMKSWCSRRVWLASVVLLGLSAATAWAVAIPVPTNVPGVDGAGNLDNGRGSSIVLTAHLNTFRRTFTAAGRAYVTNDFLGPNGKPQEVKFVNPAFVGFGTSSLYKVHADGLCKLTVSGSF